MIGTRRFIRGENAARAGGQVVWTFSCNR